MTMADVVGRDAPREAPWLVRRWWVAPLLLVLAALTTAAFNRESALTPEQIEPSVAAVVAAAEPRKPAIDWQRVVVRSRRTLSSTYRPPLDTRVETVVERIDDRILRRIDDWYAIDGQRPVYEERSLSYRGLVALRWVEREPAPLFHDILANQGWLGQTTTSLSIEADAGFPSTVGSRWRATTRRRSDQVPGSAASPIPDVDRSTTCTVVSAIEARSVYAGASGPATRVNCDVRAASTAGPDIRTDFAGSATYVHLADLDLFVLLERSETEPRSPFDADDAPPRIATTRASIDAIEAAPRASRP